MNPPSNTRNILSKSTIMMGIQCPKRLWLYKNRPDLKPPLSESQQLVFSKGTDIGKLAQQLFPGGLDASPIDAYHYAGSIQQTFIWIDSGEKIIYEAAFQFDRVMAAMDILVCKNQKWYAYEVKSSTEIKDQYINDAALQYYVITNAGLPLEDIFIIHLNKEYIRKGELDIKQLFKIESIKKEVITLQNEIKTWINDNKAVLSLKSEPQKDIGPHCTDPYACEFMEYCWSHIPEVSVFDIARLKSEKKFELYFQGMIELHQLPDGYTLSSAQQLQVTSYLENSVHIDTAEIRNWVKQLKYPLVFMDFETFMPGVPAYDNCKPYQHIPFQFSVDVQNTPHGEIKHYEFLGDPTIDPRREFLTQLISATAGSGSILVYNQSFESSRLKELQNLFPEHNSAIDHILTRIVDLMDPFQKKWYYAPSMNGSYSIKSVLPALIPDMSYDELDIGEGGKAMAAFESLLTISDEVEKQKIRQALLKYCALDTMAMVKLTEKLSQV